MFFVRLALPVVVLLLALLGCVERQSDSALAFGPAVSLWQQGNETVFGEMEQGFVARCIDGDTLALENGERVRLIGIDTPEKGQKCFEEAKKGLEELVLGKNVLLARDVSDRDKYGRLVRFVYVDGAFVNLALVEKGLAHAFDFEPDTSLALTFHEAEARALGKNGCLWAKNLD